MPKLKLTKTNIDKVAKPRDGTIIYVDTDTKGFGLRVTASGAASFVAQGMVAGTGKEARVTIGAYGVFNVDDARDDAREHLRNMRRGIDPRDLRKQDVAMRVTLLDVLEAYLERPGKLKESSKSEMRRHVERVLSSWKDKPIAKITEADVRKRHREMASGGLAGNKAAPASANAAMVTLRTLMNFASRQYKLADGKSLIQHNPVEVLKDHWSKLGTRTKRYIDKSKVGAVWNALIDARTKPMNNMTLASVDLTIFLLLTGARRMEGAALKWDRVNIDDEHPDKCWFHLPDPKSGHEVFLPMSSQLVALLKQRRQATDSEFVFPSWGASGHVIDPRGPLLLVGKIAGLHLSCHDLRRTFTNIALRECRIEKFRTDLLTNHKPKAEDVTANNYLDTSQLDWLQPEAQQIGDWIEHQGRLASAKANGENVVELRA